MSWGCKGMMFASPKLRAAAGKCVTGMLLTPGPEAGRLSRLHHAPRRKRHRSLALLQEQGVEQTKVSEALRAQAAEMKTEIAERRQAEEALRERVSITLAERG